MKDINEIIERNLSEILKDFTSKTYKEKTSNGKIITDAVVIDKVIEEIKLQANFNVVEINKEIQGRRFKATFLMKNGKPYLCDDLYRDDEHLSATMNVNANIENIYKQLS